MGSPEERLAARFPHVRPQEENGGSGMSDHLTSCLVAEELAAGELGTAYYFMLTARRARDWFELRMTPEQKAYFIPKFVGDDLYFTTVAIHEPETDFGFDYFTETPDSVRLKTRAVEQPDGSWIINGAKAYQTVGYLAKLILVRAQTPAGVQSFLVEGDSPGLARRPLSKFGRRVGDNAAEIYFDNVRVPKGRILPPRRRAALIWARIRQSLRSRLGWAARRLRKH
jgi:alkylation response protein AidB-like acyl-CoA dehydrogenase